MDLLRKPGGPFRVEIFVLQFGSDKEVNVQNYLVTVTLKKTSIGFE